MLGKLVWFILISRTSKIVLAVIISLAALTISLDVLFWTQTSPKEIHEFQQSWRVFDVVYLTFLYALIALIVGFVVLKADLDYLFTLPLDRKVLGTAMFLANLVLYSIFITYIASFAFSSSLFVITPVLGLSLASLSVVLAGTPLRVRGLVIAGIAAWFLSSLLGFPFSPLSVVYGYFVEPLSVTLVYTAVLTYLAIRRLGNYDQLLMKSLTRTSGEVKGIITFSSSSPLTAFLKVKLTYLPLTGRIGFYSGSSEYRSMATKTHWAVLISSALAGVYSAAVLFVKGVAGSFLETLVFLVNLYLLVIVYSVFSTSEMMVERAWLLFPTFGPKFLKYLALVTALRALILALPFGVADLVLSLMLGPTFLKAAIAVLLYTPLATLISLYLLAVLRPVQLRDESNPVNVEMSGNNFLFGLWSVVPAFSLLAIIDGPLYAAVIVLAVTAVAAIFLLSERFTTVVVKEMIEKGYV